MSFPKLIGGVAVALLLGMGACSVVSVERIEASHEAVKINLTGSDRGVDKMSYVSGYVWYSPLFTQIVEFPISTQIVDYKPFTVSTKDGTKFVIDPTLSFEVKPQHTGQVFAKYRKDLDQIEQTAIFSMVRDSYKNIARSYKADSLLLNQTKFETEVEVLLEQTMDNEGLKKDRLTSSITPPESYQKTIDAKNEAVQNALRIDNEVKSAEAEARVKVAQSEGYAKSVKIEADAEAYANSKKQQSLTPLLIEQERIAKWNGAYPTTVTGGGTLLNIK